MEVAPAARVQRSRVTEETFGVAPGWGRDGLYVGRAANMEVAPAALGKRSRVTGETVGAASGAKRGRGGSDGLNVGKAAKMRVAPSRVTKETFGAVSGATRGSEAETACTLEGLQKRASCSLRGGGGSA